MSAPMTGNREFRDDIVRIASLTVTRPSIEGYTFVNCRIVGPAVLALVDNVGIQHCVFEADVNALFWEIDPATRPQIYGAVAVANSTFVSCTFQGVGFAGLRELRDSMERAIS